VLGGSLRAGGDQQTGEGNRQGMATHGAISVVK
jgi:hypothetical protein